MRPLRLLVVDGNTAEGRARNAEFSGTTPSEYYAKVLRELAPGAVTDICFPADPGANLPDKAGIDGYDGVALTGSSLNIYKDHDESRPQIELARAIYDAGVPFFGSCWGIQVASVAAGGVVRPNPRGRELAFARRIMLTSEGLSHPMHAGRLPAFDAPAVHLDEVATQPEGMTVTAWNTVSGVQGAEIRHGNGTFWGVQFHPEYTFGEIAAILARYGQRLVEEGFFADLEAAEAYQDDLKTLDNDPARADIAWRYAFGSDMLDPAKRMTEIINWLEHRVKPTASARGRA